MAKLVRTAALGDVLSAAIASDARAHVTLDTPQASALSYTRVAARAPHGCEGAATVALRLEIPEGVTGVKPMPKPGWTLGIVADEAARAADGPGVRSWAEEA